MKLCKNCKHSRRSWYIWPILPMEAKFMKCLAPQIMKPDTITGKISPVYSYCSTHRNDDVLLNYISHICGLSARYYEEK